MKEKTTTNGRKEGKMDWSKNYRRKGEKGKEEKDRWRS